MMVDIKLNDEWQLTSAASGDAPVTDDDGGLLQTLQIEALTQEGELFYDEDFGWSLLDFVHAEESDLVKIEIDGRIRKKLSAHEEVKSNSIIINQIWSDDVLNIYIRFKLTDDTEHSIYVSLDRVKVEVTA